MKLAVHTIILFIFATFSLFAEFNHYDLLNQELKSGLSFKLAEKEVSISSKWDTKQIVVNSKINKETNAILIENSTLEFCKQIENKIYLLAKNNDNFVLHIISSDFNVVRFNFPFTENYTNNDIKQCNQNYYLLVGRGLYSLLNDTLTFIEQDVNSIFAYKDDLYYNYGSNGNYQIKSIYDNNFLLKASSNSAFGIIKHQSNGLFVYEENGGALYCRLFINIALEKSFWVNSNNSLYFSDLQSVYFKESDFNKISKIDSKGNISDFVTYDNSFINLELIKLVDNKLYLFFPNGLIIAEDGKIVFQSHIAFTDKIGKIKNVEVADHTISIYGDNTYILEVKYNDLWGLYYILDIFGSSAIIISLSIIAFYFYRKYRNILHLNESVLINPVSGFIFVLDRFGRLSKHNNNFLEILSVKASVPKSKNFSYYFNTDRLYSLNLFTEKALALKESINQTISLVIDGKAKEYYCNSIIIKNFAGLYRGLVITGIDISEELDRKKFTNWAQLAHDLQTNLSIIKLNAEQIDTEIGEDNFNRKSKILNQTRVIFNRIRDLVTVGRTGEDTKANFYAKEIIESCVSEFDDTRLGSIELSAQIDNFKFYCDKSKLERALCNAIQNAIRANDKATGQIIVKAYREPRFAYFVVQDNGKGMDEKTKDKMFQPFFTTGSTGIGSMIMQNVAEQHGGTIIVESEPQKGTSIIFKLPYFVK